ncbi:MAG: FecR family protein [Odoribacter sp.]|nr:FecR family protein [Odoribacter sp.]
MQEKDKYKIDWELIAKYIGRTISEFENLRLQNWLKGDYKRRLFLKHAQHYYSREDFPLPDEKQIDRIWTEFYGRMKQRRMRRIWHRIGSVAAVAVLLLGSVWMWKTVSDAPDRLAQQQQILPGNAQAILILSDGSSVSLKNNGEEKTLTDRDIQINQQEKGLVYHPSSKKADTLFNTVQVPQGGEYHLVLSDGTQVWLNAQTRFTYPVAFGGDERKVRLEGEAYFEVRPGRACFVVETQRMNVRVLGTSFNVNAYPDGKATVATLVRGKVEVLSGEGKRVLQPGEQAVRQDGEQGDIQVCRVNPLHYILWKEGYFSFRDNTLMDIMHVLARWYEMEYEFESPELEEICFFGVLDRRRDMKELLQEFEKTGKVKFEYEGNKVRICVGKSENNGITI